MRGARTAISRAQAVLASQRAAFGGVAISSVGHERLLNGIYLNRATFSTVSAVSEGSWQSPKSLVSSLLGGNIAGPRDTFLPSIQLFFTKKVCKQQFSGFFRRLQTAPGFTSSAAYCSTPTTALSHEELAVKIAQATFVDTVLHILEEQGENFDKNAVCRALTRLADLAKEVRKCQHCCITILIIPQINVTFILNLIASVVSRRTWNVFAAIAAFRRCCQWSPKAPSATSQQTSCKSYWRLRRSGKRSLKKYWLLNCANLKLRRRLRDHPPAVRCLYVQLVIISSLTHK